MTTHLTWIKIPTTFNKYINSFHPNMVSKNLSTKGQKWTCSLVAICKFQFSTLISMFHTFVKQTRLRACAEISWFGHLHRWSIWCAVPGFSKYEACDDGRIRLKRTKSVLVGQHKNKFICVRIENDKGKRQNHFVHRLIAVTFDNDIGKDVSNYVVSHEDGNTHNNAMSNLNVILRKLFFSSQMKKNGSGGDRVMIKNMKTNQEIEFGSLSACGRYCVETLGIVTNLRPLVVEKNYVKSPITNQIYQIVFCDKLRYNQTVVNIDSGESWKWISDSNRSKYYVSNYGRVKVKYSISGDERLLKQYTRSYPYKYLGCSIRSNGKANYRMTHRMVASAFVPNPSNCAFVDHIDNNPTNNNATNLRWVANHYENMQNPLTQAIFRQKRVNIPILQMDVETRKILKRYNTAREAAEFLGKPDSSNIL